MPKKMTVGDLRAALAKFTDDIPVCVSLWEGTGGTEYAEIAIVEYFPSAAAGEAGAAPSSINLSIGD